MAFSGRQYFELFSGFLVSGPDDRGEYSAYCPAHENPATSKSPSGAIQFRHTDVDRRGGIWNCYVCNPTGRDAGLNALRVKLNNRVRDGFSAPPASAFVVPKFLMQEAGTGEGKSRTVRRDGNVFFLPNIGDKSEGESAPIAAPKKKKNPPSDETIEVWVENLFDNDYPERLQFWIDRGVSAEILEQFRIGWQSATHRYTMPVCDEEGKCFDVRRYNTRDPKNKFTWYIGGSQYLYGLDQWPDSDEYVLLEGEPDTLLGRTLDLPAVCNTGGAGTWHEDWSERFSGKTVFIAYDNDKAGRENRGRAAASLLRAGAKVFLIDIPRDPEEWEDNDKGPDFTDFYCSRKGKKDFLKVWRTLTDMALPYSDDEGPTERNLEVFNPGEYNLTDLGVAERFVRHNSDRVTYVPATKEWFVWNGSVWERDETELVDDLIVLTIRNMYREVEYVPEDDQKKYYSRILGYESDSKIVAVQRRVGRHQKIVRRRSEFDADPWLVNCRNGVLNLKNRELMDHDPSFLMTKIAMANYDLTAEAPRWIKFINQIVPNPQVRSYLQAAVGYSMSGDISEHKMFIVHGSGANGKSTFFETVREVMNNYCQQIADSALRRKGNRSDTGLSPDIARMAGFRFGTAAEFGDTKLDEEVVKALTGGDTITSRTLHTDFKENPNQLKIWVGANGLPQITDNSNGMWRRVIPIKLPRSFGESDKRDPKLKEKLVAERDGIFLWIIEGFRQWQKQGGLIEPGPITNARKEYRDAQDTIGAFIDECCDVGAGKSVLVANLWQRFEFYANDIGEHYWTKKKFGMDLMKRPENFQNRQTNLPKRPRAWQGIALKEGEYMGSIKAVK